MTPTLKKKLLARINAGLDTDSAAAELGIPVSDLTNATKRFSDQIAEAVRAGSARLRGRLFKNALRDDDAKFLQDLLDKRAQASANAPITEIRRIIIPMTHCPKCQHNLGTPAGGKSRPLHTKREKPSKGANGAAHE